MEITPDKYDFFPLDLLSSEVIDEMHFLKTF